MNIPYDDAVPAHELSSVAQKHSALEVLGGVDSLLNLGENLICLRRELEITGGEFESYAHRQFGLTPFLVRAVIEFANSKNKASRGFFLASQNEGEN